MELLRWFQSARKTGYDPAGGTAVDYYEGAGKLQTPAAVLEKLAMRNSLTPDSGKLILAMVGLPARGKSFISHKLEAFLNWGGHSTRIFNAGQKRRHEPTPSADPDRQRGAATFFDPNDAAAVAAREQIAMLTLDELLEWFETGGGTIGILDATNTTRARRASLHERAAAYTKRTGVSVGIVFIESICDEEAVIEANLRVKVRSSPDFTGLGEDSALAEMQQRIRHYEQVYETIEDDEGAYIKLFNLSSKVCANRVFGRMSRRVLPFLTALHIRERAIYLVALPPGDLAVPHELGLARRLAAFLRTESDVSGLLPQLLSSTQPVPLKVASSLQNAGHCQFVAHQPGLNPLDRGSTAAAGPDLLSQMQFSERFAGGGESFADLVRRLEPCLLEVEASMAPVLILAHGSPCRALRAYFLGRNVSRCMGPASSDGALALANEGFKLVKLTPMAGGSWAETIVDLDAVTPK